MRILVIEDDAQVNRSLVHRLRELGYAVDSAKNGTDGLFMAATNEYDLLVVDYMLPGKTGAEVCQQLRNRNRSVPIIMMSVENEINTKVSLFQSGADDYLAKPFQFSELHERIKAVLRRPPQVQPNVVAIQDLQIDLVNYTVQRGKRIIPLTKKEFNLLEYLIRHKGQVVSRSSIMEHVWDIHADLLSNTVETHILNLRKKLHIPGKTKFIHTVAGRGYKLSEVA